MSQQSSQCKPKYYLIVAGGRDYTDCDRIVQELLKLVWNELKEFDVEIIHGAARGADQTADLAALRCNLVRHPCPAEWDKHGKSAGPIRNRKMGNVAHGLLAFWDGKSKGTEDMIKYMRLLKKDVRVINY